MQQYLLLVGGAARDDRRRARARRRPRLVPAAVAVRRRLRALVRACASCGPRGRTARSARRGRHAVPDLPGARVGEPRAGDAGAAGRAADRRLAGRRRGRAAPPPEARGLVAAYLRGTSSAGCDPCRTSARGERRARHQRTRARAVAPDPAPLRRPAAGRPGGPGAAARRDRHGRQRPLGQGARAAAHGRPRAGRALAVRRRRGRHRDRREGDLGLRVLDRELVALARRGASS